MGTSSPSMWYRERNWALSQPNYTTPEFLSAAHVGAAVSCKCAASQSNKRYNGSVSVFPFNLPPMVYTTPFCHLFLPCPHPRISTVKDSRDTWVSSWHISFSLFIFPFLPLSLWWELTLSIIIFSIMWLYGKIVQFEIIGLCSWGVKKHLELKELKCFSTKPIFYAIASKL